MTSAIKDGHTTEDDHTTEAAIVSINEWVVVKFIGRNNRISCCVGQIKGDNGDYLDVQFYKSVDTKSYLKFRPIAPDTEIVEREQIIGHLINHQY